MIPIEKSMLRGDWKKVTPADDARAKTYARQLPVLWKAEKPGAELRVAFRGRMLSVYDLLGPGGGMVSVAVDEMPAKSVPRIDGYCTYWRISQLSVGSLKEGQHVATLRLENEAPDKKGILFEKNRPDLEKDPEKYSENVWYASSLLLIGDVLPNTRD
jgi:hypothetical protein